MISPAFPTKSATGLREGAGPPADPKLASLDRLADLLDTRWRIPGTSWRFGLDGVAGLLPGVGDMATGLIGAYIILQAAQLGAPGHVIARMAGNLLLDTAVGSIPVIGSIFDVVYKANRRNVRLVRRHFERTAPLQRSAH